MLTRCNNCKPDFNKGDYDSFHSFMSRDWDEEFKSYMNDVEAVEPLCTQQFQILVLGPGDNKHKFRGRGLVAPSCGTMACHRHYYTCMYGK